MPISKFTVSRDDNVYEAWPDVILTQKQKLICVFSECTYHTDRSYTKIVYVESMDRGRTWSSKKRISEATSGVPFWNCARISRLSDGRLAVICDKIYEKDENKAKTKIFIWFADPEGKKWEGPYETPVKGIVPDKLLELGSGRWIIATHSKSKKHGFLEQHLWYSDDKGKQWYGPVTVASEEGLNLCEASILPIEDGTLVAFMRENSFTGMDCYKAISKDNGLTWEGVYRVPLPGCHRPVTGYLNSGLIMITYRFFQGGKRGFGKGMQNFFAAVTDVDSVKEKQRCEQWARIVPIDYDKNPHADLGYSGWVQFDDGEIYIVNYILDDAPKAQIRGYSLKETDLYQEKTCSTKQTGLVTENGMIPSATEDAVLEWKAPKDGTINIEGTASKVESGGNGVQIKIMKNSTQIWPSSGWQDIAYNDLTGVSHDFDVSVETGDSIYFIVNSKSSNSYDWTEWDPTITYQ